MSIVPGARPELTRAAALVMAKAAGLEDVTGPFLLGRRGYYRDTMGARGRNDIGIYDDAIALVSPTAFATFNANTDPSRERTGMATLKPGIWTYQRGIHGQNKAETLRYMALIQAAPVTVHRHGEGDDTGWFGINVHRGGYNTTSSLGCQTIHPSQWEAFFALVTLEMRRTHRETIPYVLTERT